ncbi:MAG: hypothetical protein NTV01_13560 [Bacteroidia bacterium]|nr:hypothetical protein [Bacteroidia bacterium]
MTAILSRKPTTITTIITDNHQPTTVSGYLCSMNLKICLIFLVSIISNANLALAQLVKVEDFPPRRADTIILERNWRTRHQIIFSELEFSRGDTVNPENLSLSMKKIWNLQNFAMVGYRWDSLADGRSALILTTRDALTISPIICGRYQMSPDLTGKIGLVDRNFLGRNIKLEMRLQLSVSEPWYKEIKVTIPRQLLWKNMSVGAGYRKGAMAHKYNSDQLFINIVNPFDKDYQFTFSPDLETGFLRHQSLPPDLEPGEDLAKVYQPYNHPFWYLRFSESVGTITHRRHQEEGYNISGMIGGGFGLNSETRNYFEGSIIAEYNKLISPRLQFSVKWEGYCNSTSYESFWTRFGSGNIRGLYYGALTGQLLQLASAGLYYTWLDWDYLAVEQSAFVQYASAITSVGDWSSIKRHYAIGTGFYFTIPMYPVAGLLISFSYNPNRKKWFYFDM